jgi:membrane dipeptidase
MDMKRNEGGENTPERRVAMIDDRMDCCDGADPVSRRTFLLSLLSTITSDCAGPTSNGSAKRERELLDEAANLQHLAAVDLHSHPGPFGGRNVFPEASVEIASAFADMRRGGLDAALFSLPSDRPVIRRNSPTGRTRQFREPERGELFRFVQTHFDKVLGRMDRMTALSPHDVFAFKRKGSPCAIIGLEGADALEGDLSRVKLFYDRGVRVIQLLHYRINEVGDIMTEPVRHGGLTPFGRNVVKEMNRTAMIIDVAHAHFETLRGVVAESRHPVIDSHTRSMNRIKARRARSNNELRAVANKGGVIGVWPLTRKERGETFDDFVKDIDYVKFVVGIDHVGIATDLNGLGTRTVVPTHKEFALITAGLLSQGRAEADVKKIIGGNFIRVFREVTENRV